MTDSPAIIPSFGRRKGHKLRSSRAKLMESLLPSLIIPLPEDALSLPALFPQSPDAPLWFEIGFGAGEHLAGQAERNPNVNFIGCEPYINGISRLLAVIDERSLSNIRLHDGDARLLLEKMPDCSVDRIFVLFPDPWPKVRHHKRRIVSLASLELFYGKLKKGGRLRIATDHVDYGNWILEQLAAFSSFQWTAKSEQDWQSPPNDWIKTRYQEKAEAEGRAPLFLDLYKELG